MDTAAGKNVDNQIWTYTAITVAGLMGTLARMVWADTQRDQTTNRQFLLGVITGTGTAAVLAPIIARIIGIKFGIEGGDIHATCGAAWLIGVVGMNLVVTLTKLNLSRWIPKSSSNDGDNK